MNQLNTILNSNFFRRGALILLFVTLILIVSNGRETYAHGGITVDGSSGDWCFSTLLPLTGPDTRSTLTPPACGLGNEVIWEDASGDTLTAGHDITRFATTADSSTLFFDVGLATTGSEHVQIAISVTPGAGRPFWYDPHGGLPPLWV